jgi:hypothetical protein
MTTKRHPRSWTKLSSEADTDFEVHVKGYKREDMIYLAVNRTGVLIATAATDAARFLWPTARESAETVELMRHLVKRYDELQQEADTSEPTWMD